MTTAVVDEDFDAVRAMPITLVGAPTTVGRLRTNPWIRSARPNQWSKSALVLAAPFAALHLSVTMSLRLVVAVALTCMAASGTYFLNDAIDAPADRLHPTKRFRPIAAGQVGRVEAVFVASMLLTLAPTLGRFVNARTGLALAAYVVLTVAYSTKLKVVPIVDVMVLAAGFVVRVLIGAAASRTAVSAWFLLAVAAAAVMVATGKRRSEVRELGGDAISHRRALRRYDNATTARLLVGSGAVLCVCLIAWVVIGRGGPHLEESWAAGLLVPVAVGIGRYLRIAFAGGAAQPERLVRDGVLLAASATTAVVFVAGSVLS